MSFFRVLKMCLQKPRTTRGKTTNHADFHVRFNWFFVDSPCFLMHSGQKTTKPRDISHLFYEHILAAKNTNFTAIGDRLHGLRFFLGIPCVLFLSICLCRRVFGVTELWRSHVSGCAYICSISMELIDVSENLLFRFVVESSASSCEEAPCLLKQLRFVCFSVFSPKPRVEGSFCPCQVR